jgi:hypothetical protein
MVFDLGKSTAGFTVTELKLEEVVLQWPTSAETINDFKTTVYPNPATGKVYINNLDGFNEYAILNMQGEVLKSGILNSHQNQVNVESYASGMYFMILTNGNNRHSCEIAEEISFIKFLG